MDSCPLLLSPRPSTGATTLEIESLGHHHGMQSDNRSGNPRAGLVLGLLVAALLAAATGAGAAVPDQVTEDHSGSGCTSALPVADATGTIAAWQSDCNPAGTNADGSIEIFRATVGSPPAQLTTSPSPGPACTSSRPSISANGNVIAFESSCDLTGSNADGNVEIFLWKSGTLSQLTNSLGCDNLAPSVSSPGKYVAFDSTCNLFGTANGGHGSEIFRVSDSGVLEQLTSDAVGNCDSTSASISSNGKLVAFDSDCDLVGQNENLAIEIFTVTSDGVVKQRTFATDDSCSSVHPSMDDAGALIGFHSDCNFTGSNGDHSDEIFTVDAALEVEQVSAAGNSCASGEVHMAADGNALVFSSYCGLNSFNGDGSIEVFQAGVGKGKSGVLAVTGGNNCSSMAGGVSANGSLVMFDSDCNPASGNADGSVEVFRGAACACGRPSTRKSTPLASDALFVLKAAVGSQACNKCECDVNNDGSISATDGLRTLKAAVGQDFVLACPAP